MAQEIGESRERWAGDIWEAAEAFAERCEDGGKPFYVVYAAKPDKGMPSVFRQTFKAYYQKPPKLLGVLVWYVDRSQGLFAFSSDLSSPPDIPVPEELLSKNPKDFSPKVAEQGKRLNVLLS